MALKQYKPTSPARRLMTVSDFAEITKSKPEKKLTKSVRKSGGRNTHGHITTRHIGGGHKRRYRVIDWRRDKDGVPGEGRVDRVRPEPHGAHRAPALRGRREALHPRAGRRERRRHAALRRRRSTSAPATPCRLKAIPLGTVIHNVETQPGSGGKMIRSAGSFGQLMAKEGKYAQIRMPSGEVRKVLQECKATIGQLSNVESSSVRLGKAGKSRWLGRPPDGARPRDEPGRPPARRRRGQVRPGQPASGVAVGLEDQGPEDSEQPPH